MSHPIPGHDYVEPTLEGEPDLDDFDPADTIVDHHDPDSRIIRAQDEPEPDELLLDDSEDLKDDTYFGEISDSNYDSYVSRHL